MWKKIGRLFVIKTRFEACLIIYALAVGAMARGSADRRGGMRAVQPMSERALAARSGRAPDINRVRIRCTLKIQLSVEFPNKFVSALC